MKKSDIITLSSDEESTEKQASRLSKQKRTHAKVKEEPPEKKFKEEDEMKSNDKAKKEVSTVAFSNGCSSKEEESKVLFVGNLKLSPKKRIDLGNDALFEKFVDVCHKSKDTPEMTKILLKTRNYYKKAKPGFILSQEFHDLLVRNIANITNEPRCIYVYIKDVVDELRVRKLDRCSGPVAVEQKVLDNANDLKTESAEIVKKEAPNNEISKILEESDRKYNEKKIRKLSRALRAIHHKIKKLEEKEVNFDDENDSTYIMLERYKERFCKIHDKLCELTGDAAQLKSSRRKVTFRGTSYPEINKCIEKFVNNTRQFPDFFDILNLVKKVQTEGSPELLRSIAQDAFLSIGRQLQEQRQNETWDSLCGFIINNEVDPADSNSDLKSILQDNSKKGNERIQEVIDKFAEKQVADKLEAEEVADEDANKSGGSEQEEEEADEDEEEEEEKNFVENVLKGEDDMSSEDDAEATNHDEEIANSTSQSDGESDVVDIHRTGILGPVSPPVLDEDLSKRGSCIKDPSWDENINGSDDTNLTPEESSS